MDIREVMEYLPHRYPFLLIDRVVSCEAGRNIVAIKNVTVNEPFFAGHFPHYKVMPGVLVIEAMAQASAILWSKTDNKKLGQNSIYYFVGIDGARFKKPVTPGDQLHLHVDILRKSRGLVKFRGRAEVGGVLVAQAELLCTERPI